MKVIPIIKYQCEKCDAKYGTEEQALHCESIRITQGKGVQVGDIVIVTKGEGSGEKAKVTRVGILSPEGAGGYQRYIHTYFVNADIIDGWGSRTLMWDSYDTT